MSEKEKAIHIFGVRIDRVDMDEAFNRFLVLLNRERTAAIYTPNPEMIMHAAENPDFRDTLLSGDLVVPDGIGVIYAAKLHHLGLKDRVPGIELMDRILRYCHSTKRSIFLFGGKPGVSETAGAKILEQYPNIDLRGTEHGYHNEEGMQAVIDRINEVKPDVLFVALGFPKQEQWIEKNRRILNTHVAMGVGGSLDVWSGTVRRAPVFFQKTGLEWFYRLMKEPHRIGRMMVLPRFLLKVLTTRNISG